MEHIDAFNSCCIKAFNTCSILEHLGLQCSRASTYKQVLWPMASVALWNFSSEAHRPGVGTTDTSDVIKNEVGATVWTGSPVKFMHSTLLGV